MSVKCANCGTELEEKYVNKTAIVGITFFDYMAMELVCPKCKAVYQTANTEKFNNKSYAKNLKNKLNLI